MKCIPPAFKITRSCKRFELWSIHKWSCLDRHQGMVVGEERQLDGWYIYTIKPLNVSKYRLFRSIQIWIVKITFK